MEPTPTPTPPSPDAASPRAAIGRTDCATDTITPGPVIRMQATINDAVEDPAPGDPLPPLWHWLYTLPAATMTDVGPDGHARLGGFLPAVPQERRMWAGGRLTFHDVPLGIGGTITRESEILDVQEKTGAAGAMVFVTVRHAISTARGLAVEEDHDIVYVARPPAFVPPKPRAAPPDPLWREPLPVDPVRLFRFSALTFNGHRIHYDRTYATEVEGFPGLVVHGPLQAMAMMESARRQVPSGRPHTFAYRGVRPLFDTETAAVQGYARADGGLDLMTVNGDGFVCMTATVHWHSADDSR
ncbi:acyl-CoA dehydrogenase [Roseospira marina]|uniref:Acyl-CoA dehydrogenase n=2 Tax=Roseospira marina TaxID=140057 RepID=A0A5M6IDG6_9PROT|nr:MaoC family dehydratase N-terminal domain-containing protein [Roseospira marina]KAA5606321.1 acyl-CoA dehydrogenase [Roseospira marina]MBB4314343.1 3-methylfumaryl-CoA hydratase [Roseospira marina]MBB5087503.1 3-methylfumaryl-CoA hydratase [Roseospira marina]